MNIRTQRTEHITQTTDKKSLASVFCLLASVFCLLACSPSQEKLYKDTRSSMYTIVSITVSSDSEDKAKKSIDKAFNEIDKLSELLNFYSEDSEVSMINRNAGKKPVLVSPETLEIINKALYVSENTEGAFDITVGPVVRLWDFQNKILPEKKMMKEKLKFVGYKNIIVDNEKSTVFLKTKGVLIDLGGIIKGYAADKAVEILKKNGIKSGIVAIAGDIKIFGKKPDGGLWNVGIQNPRPTLPILPLEMQGKGGVDDIIATIGFSDMAISTSGDYQKFFIKNDKRYHHLLNPKTGYPVDDYQSVTVIAKDAVFTDAFATGIFILGNRNGMNVLERLGFDGIIIDKNGKIFVTKGIKDKIKWINRAME